MIISSGGSHLFQSLLHVHLQYVYVQMQQIFHIWLYLLFWS